MTKKDKVEQFDRLKREHDKLELALHNLTVGKFPFGHLVSVKANEIDSQYAKDAFKLFLSLSDRSMPMYLVRWCDARGKVTNAEVIDELDVEANRDNQIISWRMIRHGIWKIAQKGREVGK